MRDFWPTSGFRELRRDARGWLVPSDDYLRRFLALPELALVGESCAAERSLHDRLQAAPAAPVDPAALDALADADARRNYALFLRFRDALIAAGTLEGWYLALFRAGTIDIPPLFVDRVAEAIVHGLVDGCDDPFEVRAAELLFRAQRIAVRDGKVLAGDRDAVDFRSETGGLGEIGRLLVQNAALAPVDMEVLVPGNAGRYWAESERHAFLLDLSHEIASTLGHGLTLTMRNAHSGLKALARVLERWLAHFLGLAVTIAPLARIDDAAWSWHVGLDSESTALLNELFRSGSEEPVREERLIGLFRLDFASPAEMRDDVADKPVYLGLAMTAERTLKLKPQNLLVNLPLAALM